jgi:hypothetical protein
MHQNMVSEQYLIGCGGSRLQICIKLSFDGGGRYSGNVIPLTSIRLAISLVAKGELPSVFTEKKGNRIIYISIKYKYTRSRMR